MKSEGNTNYIQQEEHFKIKYEGDNEVSLNTLVQTLYSLNELIDLAVDGDFEYEYKVTACEKGSFVLDINATAFIAQTLITPENISFIKNSLSVVKEWFEIKKHLRNSPPAKVETTDKGVNITNTRGDVFNSSFNGAKILYEPKINANVINFSCNLCKSSRQGFSIQDDTDNIFFGSRARL